jgi:hypothetical protein
MEKATREACDFLNAENATKKTPRTDLKNLASKN